MFTKSKEVSKDDWVALEMTNTHPGRMNIFSRLANFISSGEGFSVGVKDYSWMVRFPPGRNKLILSRYREWLWKKMTPAWTAKTLRKTVKTPPGRRRLLLAQQRGLTASENSPWVAETLLRSWEKKASFLGRWEFIQTIGLLDYPPRVLL